MRRLPILALLLLVATPLRAQTDSLETAIDEADRLGKLLFAYDQAAWHGTDAVAPLFDQATLQDRVHGYVAEAIEGGWRVGFGRLSADEEAFLVEYEAELDSEYAVLDAEAYKKPTRRTGFMRDAMLARNAAVERFEPMAEIQHNTAVLPAPDGQLYAYVLPSQPEHLVYYVGGDVRYTFDPDEEAVVAETPLHTTILTFDLREDPQAITYASAVLTDAPTETDVFYAISRPGLPDTPAQQASHYVFAGGWVYFLGPDGIRLKLDEEVFRSLSTRDGRTLDEPEGDPE